MAGHVLARRSNRAVGLTRRTRGLIPALLASYHGANLPCDYLRSTGLVSYRLTPRGTRVGRSASDLEMSDHASFRPRYFPFAPCESPSFPIRTSSMFAKNGFGLTVYAHKPYSATAPSMLYAQLCNRVDPSAQILCLGVR